jgi:hypothetical protein
VVVTTTTWNRQGVVVVWSRRVKGGSTGPFGVVIRQRTDRLGSVYGSPVAETLLLPRPAVLMERQTHPPKAWPF